jgi:hypothetical protein
MNNLQPLIPVSDNNPGSINLQNVLNFIELMTEVVKLTLFGVTIRYLNR